MNLVLSILIKCFVSVQGISAYSLFLIVCDCFAISVQHQLTLYVTELFHVMMN